MKIVLKNNKSGEKLDFECEESWYVSQVIDLLAFRIGSQPKDVKLIYKSIILKPTKTFREQRVDDHATITYVVKAAQAHSQSPAQQKAKCVFIKYQRTVEVPLPPDATVGQLRQLLRQKVVGDRQSLKLYHNQRILQDDAQSITQILEQHPGNFVIQVRGDYTISEIGGSLQCVDPTVQTQAVSDVHVEQEYGLISVRVQLYRTNQVLRISELKMTDSVMDLKQRVSVLLNGILAEDIQLVHKRKVITDSQLLSQVPLSDGSLVIAIIKRHEPTANANIQQEASQPLDDAELPKSYLEFVGLKKSSILNQQKFASVRQAQPVPTQQKTVDGIELQSPSRQIPVSFILKIKNNPLLKDYCEDICQKPQRLERVMKNQRVRDALKDFFGGEPLLTAAINKKENLAQLILKSCSLANRRVLMNKDQYTKLSEKYQPQLGKLRQMGIVFDEREALQLLDKYNGDIQAVASALLGL